MTLTFNWRAIFVFLDKKIVWKR